MSKKEKARKVTILWVNILLSVMEFVGLVLMVELFKSYNLHPFGWFKYYTQLSNIFSMIAALAVAFFAAKDLIKGTDNTPLWVQILKFSSACCLFETLLVTMFVLAPMGMMGGFIPLMFEGPNLFHHLLCPIVSVLSFIILEKHDKLPLRYCLYALIPTLIYGVVAVTLNILKIWYGPYPFLYVYEQPLYMSIIWAIVIPGAAFAITLIVRLFSNIRLNKKKES